MKKKICCLLILLVALIALLPISLHAESAKFFTIGANPAEDCNTSMNIVWHTEKGVTGSYVLYTEKEDASWSNARRVDGEATLNTAFAGKNACYGTTSDSLKVPYEFMKNEATLEGLEPGTKYMYKITDGTEESDVRYFKTGDQEFTFIWTSDFHAYSGGGRLANATKAIDAALDLANNNVDFMFSTGDIVAHGGTYQWWNQVSGASWYKNYMFCCTLGNHDWMTRVDTYYSTGASYGFFDACFNNPKNGFSGQENVCYYFYYGDALFICVNTETESALYLDMTKDEFVKAQQDWVEEVLQNNTAQYIFLFQHYQAFSTAGGYNSAGYTRWHEICDKYGVDIMFTGNSHVYMRSLPLYKDQVSTDQSKGTVYMVAPSSDGDRGVEYKAPTSHTDQIVASWSGVSAIGASLVKVTQDGISIRLIGYDAKTESESDMRILDTSRVLPKRGPSERAYKDLEGFDKAQFEESFAIQVNQKSLSTPKVLFSNEAYNVLRSMKVYNKDTGTVYYDGVFQDGASNYVLGGVEKGKLNIGILLRYFDSTEKELSIEVDNNYKWGSISNPRITKGSEKDYIEWNEEVNETRISSIEVLMDGELYKKVAAGTKKVALPADDGARHKLQLVVKDIDGDIVYSSEEISYPLVKTYTVTFVDSFGKTIKSETVEEGKSATAPDFTPQEGFRFVGWDADFSNVTKDLVVNAKIEEIEEPDVIEPGNVDEPTTPDTPDTPDEPTTPDTPDTPEPISPAPTKKGCGSGAIQSVWYIISILGLAFVLRKRYN